MELSSRLRDSLKDHLQWNKPRLTCFVELLLALLRIQRTNLARLAVSMSGTAEVKSRCRWFKKMMAVLAIALKWKYRLVEPLRVKKQGRPEQSWFRYGLDYLADQLMARTPSSEESLRMLILFLCPPSWMVVKKNGRDTEKLWQRAF